MDDLHLPPSIGMAAREGIRVPAGVSFRQPKRDRNRHTVKKLESLLAELRALLDDPVALRARAKHLVRLANMRKNA